MLRGCLQSRTETFNKFEGILGKMGQTLYLPEPIVASPTAAGGAGAGSASAGGERVSSCLVVLSFSLLNSLAGGR